MKRFSFIMCVLIVMGKAIRHVRSGIEDLAFPSRPSREPGEVGRRGCIEHYSTKNEKDQHQGGNKMSGLYFLFPTLLAILFSFLIVRAASVALMITGMEKKKARFQASSRFSGTGFMTKDTESVMDHPQRQKIFTGKGFLRRVRCLSG